MKAEKRTILLRKSVTWDTIGAIKVEICAPPKANVVLRFQDIEIVDPACLGWLCLLCRSHSVSTTFDVSSLDRDSSIFYTIAQYLELISEIWASSVSVVPSSHSTVSSSKFFPIVPIDSHSSENIFRTPYGKLISPFLGLFQKEVYWEGFDFKNSGGKTDEIEHYVKRQIATRISLRDNSIHSENTVFLLYFLRLVADLRYTKPLVYRCTLGTPMEQAFARSASTSRVANWTASETKSYWGWLQHFLEEEVFQRSTFSMILFGLMIAQYEPDFASPSSAIEEIKRVAALATEYSSRMMELVQNVLEHASTKEGVIVSRAFQLNELVSLYPERTEYLQSVKVAQTRCFLMLDIVDIGDSSILSTSISQWESSESPVLREDAEELKSSRSLKKLFFPAEKPFFHQMVRTIGCLGLVVFAQLTKRCCGYFEVVSKDAKDLDGTLWRQLVWSGDMVAEQEYRGQFQGTKYSVMLPVNLDLVSRHQEFLPDPHLTCAKQFAASNAIVSDHNASSPGNTPALRILSARLSDLHSTPHSDAISKYDLETDISNSILAEYKRAEGLGDEILLSVDCSNIPGEQIGSLLRILARLQMEYMIRAIVIHGLEESSIRALIDALVDTSGRDFWSAGRFIVAYDNFAQPLIIGGKNRSQYLALNRHIDRAMGIRGFLSAQSDRAGYAETDPQDPSAITRIVERNPLFYWNPGSAIPALIPLHYLLRNAEGKTLVEKRLERIIGELIDEGGVL